MPDQHEMEASAMTDEIHQKLVRESDKLTVLPAAAVEALEIAKNPNCSIAAFACIVQRDARLASDVLAMANHSAIWGGNSISSIEQAIIRLGFRQCRNLIMSASISSLAKRLSLGEQWVREVLMEHFFNTATCCTYLNRALGLGFQGEEFSCGLVHDLGRFLLACIVPEQFTEADPLTFDEDNDPLAVERDVMGTDHCQVGAWFAENKDLPSELIDVIRHHHSPFDPNDNRPLVALVAASDQISNHLQRFGDLEDYDVSRNSGLAALRKYGIEDVGERVSQALPAIHDAIVADSAVSCSTL